MVSNQLELVLSDAGFGHEHRRALLALVLVPFGLVAWSYVLELVAVYVASGEALLARV